MSWGGESDESGFGADDGGGGYGGWGTDESGGWDSGDSNSEGSGSFSGSGYSGFSSFASDYAPKSFTDRFADAFGDLGTFGKFGDVNLGTDINTAFSLDGIENIGYSTYGGTRAPTTDISKALAALSAVDQEALFRSVVEPTLDQFQGWQGQAASKIASTVFGVIANAVIPGVGTLSKITGITGYLADRMMDASFSQALGEQMGIRDPNAISNTNPDSNGSEIITSALNSGMTPQAILQRINTTIRNQGGDMSTWDDIWNSINGKTAANASTDAANTAADYQQQALNYLQQRESVPLQIAGGAMQQLGGLYGLPGGVGDQQTFIDQAQNSPLYNAIQSSRGSGEDAIMRNQAMTGGFRSGDMQENLFQAGVDLDNQALLSSYNEQLGGLQYLAGMQPGGASDIANAMSGIGDTLAAGKIGAAQADQTGTGNLLSLAGSAYQAAGGLGGIIDTGKDVFDTVSSWF